MKSVKKWRDEALKKGWLVEFKPGEVAEGDQAWRGGGRGKKWPKVAIFISHTWWDRDFKDESNDPDDPYDRGAPDYQTGWKKKLEMAHHLQGSREADGSEEALAA